jgi:protein-disulfide isomerase
MKRTGVWLGIGAALLLPAAVLSAAQPNIAEQQRIERAVRDYAAKLETEEVKNQDRLIAANSTAMLSDPGTPVIGNARADVAIVEFTDYTCPYCKAVEPRVEKLLKDDPRVKLVVKEYPILTPASLVAAKAALASMKQGKYARFHQTMMTFRGQLTADAVYDMARDSGVDVNRLRKDMESPEIADEIIATFNLARAIRAFQTPTFIVNDHLLTGASADIDFPKVVAAARTHH